MRNFFRDVAELWREASRVQHPKTKTSTTKHVEVRVMKTPEKLRKLQQSMGTGLLERETAIRFVLLSALAGEHLLLIGPPGTAKSQLARRIRRAFTGATYFERLLTKFSLPEELFGPYSIPKLQVGEYERLTDKYLPTASVAFLDEIFKANSAILNSLLTLLNEREFDNGTRREKTPLITVVAASNELPEEGLEALFDRFLLRLYVRAVKDETFSQMLVDYPLEDMPAIPEEQKIGMADIKQIQQSSKKVALPKDIQELLSHLRQWCAKEEIVVSDRRWLKAVKLLQVSAHTNGRNQVSIWDCWLLSYCLWNKPEQQEKIHKEYAQWVGAGGAIEIGEYEVIISQLEKALKKDSAEVQKKDSRKRPLFLVKYKDGTTKEKPLYNAPGDVQVGSREGPTNDNRGWLSEELDRLNIYSGRGSTYYGEKFEFKKWERRIKYLGSPASCRTSSTFPKAMKPKRYSSEDIKVRVDSVNDHLKLIVKLQNDLVKRIEEITTDLINHLWIEKSFYESASKNLNEWLKVIKELAKRLRVVKKGFGDLPIKDDRRRTRPRKKSTT